MPKASPQSSSGSISLFNPATIILVCAFSLVTLGLTVLFSASLPVDTGSPYRFIEKQVVWLAVALMMGLAALRIDLEWMRKFVWVGYALSLLMLCLVLVPSIGHLVNGSRSWIRIGPISFQVAEFAKLAIVFFLAHYFSLQQKNAHTFWKGFVFPCAAIGVMVGLILLQTDLGTAMIIAVVCLCLLFLAGTRLWLLLPSCLIGVIGALFFVVNDPERWSRFTSLFDMEAQKGGDAYQVWQAILAFGAGGISGVGLGNGRQQWQFLPEAHNDFIFAIVGEELGLWGTLAVVLAYATLFLAGIWHLRKAPNVYQYLLAAGCLLLICIQSVVNLGVVTGQLPTTGLPLPFISYGGSNLVVMCLCVAILLNTCVAWKTPALKQGKRSLKEI